MITRRPIRLLCSLFFLAFSLLAVGALTGCSSSACYIVRAGWKEAGILLRRRDISSLIKNTQTEPELKAKLALTLKVRDYAKSIGLKPNGSYSTYSQVEGDVLVWVLSASSQVRLRPVTWWFPIAGPVPYKGFFTAQEALIEKTVLEAKNLDVYVRPSPAFSTLGWFDDPLLSTVARFDEASLADTVIHELLHNTYWVNGAVSFNETLANFVGAMGSYHYFLGRDGPDSEQAKLAESRWKDELRFARFLEELTSELNTLYEFQAAENEDEQNRQKVVTQRKKVFDKFSLRYESLRSDFQTDAYRNAKPVFNNAVIIAHRLYLDRPWLFAVLYEKCGSSIELFLKEIERVIMEAEDTGRDPYIIINAGQENET